MDRSIARRRTTTFPGKGAKSMCGALDVCLRGGQGVLRPVVYLTFAKPWFTDASNFPPQSVFE